LATTKPCQTMYVVQVPFASPPFDELLALRDQVLRQPLGLQFHLKDIAEEWDSIHLASYSDSGQLLGGLVLKPLDEETIKMRQVAVLPMAQKKGVGSFLVREAEKLAYTLGFRQMHLHARQEAVSFYKKLGYNKQGKPFTEVGIRHYAMSKKLETP